MAKRGRREKVDWEAYKPQLLELKYVQNKSLTEICTVLYEKLGVAISAGRVSQKFTQWKNQVQPKEAETVTHAN